MYRLGIAQWREAVAGLGRIGGKWIDPQESWPKWGLRSLVEPADAHPPPISRQHIHTIEENKK